MTSHEGYILECPTDFEHRNRDSVKFIARAMVRCLRVLQIVGSFMWNIPSRPGDVAAATLSSIQSTADNRTRLNTVGIDTNNMFLVQEIGDGHQMRVMEELLRSAAESRVQPNITGNLRVVILNDGRRIWVCKQCYGCLQRGEPIEESSYLSLSQYVSLATRQSEVEVTLCNAESVIFLTENLPRSTKTVRLVIHIEPRYFEDPDRAKGTRYTSIAELFNALGHVLRRQKRLVHLEIHGNNTNGKMYTGLDAVFQCRSLKVLRLSGVPCLLQEKNIPMKCRKLQELLLKGMRFDTEQSANNYWRLVKVSPSLGSLKVTASVLSMVKPRTTSTQLSMVVSLEMSGNELCGQQANDFCENGTCRRQTESEIPQLVRQS
ncbi:hypothetical protein BGX31_001528 [Mortierella sp. GBA43]|nr:hypothetical protein BGX31_001528 [Mortierella sp. GBA43]